MNLSELAGNLCHLFGIQAKAPLSRESLTR
jgi:hypothetical protein